VVVSSAVRDDPEVAGMVDAAGGSLAVEAFEAGLRGFDQTRFALFRIRPAGPLAEVR
jgi:hypothetical protein